MFSCVKSSCFRGCDFAGNCLRPARTVSAGASHQIDMNVVVVRGVVTGRKDGVEVVTGGELYVVQEALFFRRAVPAFLNRNPAPIPERESCDVDRIAESVL